MVKIRVKHEFYDKENDLKLRSVGDTLTVSKDRAEYLVRMKIAEVIDSKGGDPESVSYTHLTLPTNSRVEVAGGGGG